MTQEAEKKLKAKIRKQQQQIRELEIIAAHYAKMLDKHGLLSPQPEGVAND